MDSHRPGGGDPDAPLDGDGTPEVARDPTPERAFGPYLIGDLIATGPFTGVYRARETQSGYHLNIKIATGLTGRPAARAEFLQQGARAKTFEPLSGIEVHDLGLVGDYAYIAYRSAVACSLADVLAGAPLDPVDAFRVCEVIASVLDAAHADGIVHGRVHPGNVLFESADIFSGRVFLSDFARPPADRTDAHPYSAPEWQPEGAYDRRADIFSLACVLFECLTGVPPVGPRWLDGVFEAWHDGDAPVRLHELRADTNPALDEFMDRALSGDVNRRPHQVSTFVRDAWAAFQAEREVLVETIETPTIETPRRKVPTLAIVVAAVAVAAIGLGFLGARLFSNDAPVAMTTTTTAPPALESLATEHLLRLVPNDRCVAATPERRFNALAAITCEPVDSSVDHYQLLAFASEVDQQAFMNERVSFVAGPGITVARANARAVCAPAATSPSTTALDSSPTITTTPELIPDYRYWAAADLNRGQVLCTPPSADGVRLDFTGTDSLISGYATRADGDTDAIGKWWEQKMTPVLLGAAPFTGPSPTPATTPPHTGGK